MKIVTIDASAATSWLFPGQTTRAADAFLMEEESRRFIAPSIFVWEVGNQILNRARKSGTAPSEMLEDLQSLDIEIALPLAAEDILASTEAALSRRLSLFDNAYLQLCIDRQAALASRDADLLQAAVVLGVKIYDLRD